MNQSLCRPYEQNQIEKYLPLVQKIVRQMNIKETSTIDRDDLYSIGVMGLMDAMNKYDSSKKTSFETYARTRIRGSIIDELRRLGVVSRDKMYAVKKYYKSREDLTQKLLREPTDDELCEYLGISSIELSKIFMTLHYLAITSLESVIYGEDGSQVSLIDMVEDKQAENVLVKLENLDRYDELKEAISKLDQRDQLILQFYYVEELGVQEISEILDISVSRVSQLHGRSLAQIRERLKMKKY